MTEIRTHYVYFTEDASGSPVYSITDIESDATERGILAAWRVETPHASGYKAVAYVLSDAAGLWMPSGVTVTRLIPRPATADEKLDAARSVLRADYWQDVIGVRDELARLIERGDIADADDATQWLDETVDGHQRVIYTGQAIECLLFSDNEDAHYDEMGTGPDFGDGAQWSQLAYFAFRADIMAEIGDLEDFIDTHKPAPPVCDGCGEDIEDAEEGDNLCADCAEDKKPEARSGACDMNDSPPMRCDRCAHTVAAHATETHQCRMRGCRCEALRLPRPMPNYDAPGA